MLNLACSNEQKELRREDAVNQCVKELNAAGIRAIVMNGDAPNSEVPGYVFGSLSMWSFRRAWVYWVAEGPGIPVETAELLHATHGSSVRVAGHCGCPSPREWYKGFGVGSYHVDSQEGLNALADAIRSVYDARMDPDSKSYCGSEIKQGLLEDYRSKTVVERCAGGK